MKIKIYQIDMDKDEHGVKFMSMDFVKTKTGTDILDSKIYDKVYEGEVDCSDLEKVYEMFNLNHPADYAGHSLTVSDIIEVSGSENVKDGFYYCNDVGFTEVNFIPVQEKEPQTKEKEKMKILLVEPHKTARFIEIEDDLKIMQRLVGGYIAEYFPFSDDTVIVCNDEGKLDGLPLNRAIYAEAPLEEVSYSELKNRMRECEREGRKHLVGHVVFTKDSFDKEYTEEERTYVFSSANKAFIPNMGGYSIYASSLDGSDRNVRIEQYMKDEYGGKDGWKIEKCYLKDEEKREMIEIIAGTFFICRAPIDSENFTSLTEKQQEKYMDMFKYPERFFRIGDEIKAVPYKPKDRSLDR